MNKKEVSSKNLVYHLVIILIIISLIFSGCMLNQEDEHEWPDPYFEYTYSLNLTSDNETTVLYPVPIFVSEGNISKLVDELRLSKGDAEYKITQTRYGAALNISFEGTIHLEGIKKVNKSDSKKVNLYKFSNLSMQKNETENYNVYSSAESKINKFKCVIKSGGEDVDTPIYSNIENITLKKGWQDISISGLPN